MNKIEREGEKMRGKDYNRKNVIEYARKWALSRNPEYYNFDMVGGDCTNFASQCMYAGSKIMNHTQDFGWYYHNGNDKSPSWSGVEYLYQFLIRNKGIGPQAIETTQNGIEIGDMAQLSFDGQKFEHTLVITKIENKFSLKGIKIACHTLDAFNKAIAEYSFQKIRWIHIERVGV